MKKFYYDILLDEENICNLNQEKTLLLKGIEAKKKLVVYGPRNCGKTSLVKNVIIPRFKHKHKDSFVLFCDLMEVKNLDAIDQRIQLSFQKSFSESFPKKKLIERAKEFLKNLRPQVQFDPISGQPSISLVSTTGEKSIPMSEIFETIKNEISTKVPTLIVLDEFQDISFVDQAQGLFRQSLQELKETPVVFMGSKKHLLSDIFAKPKAPLAFTGEDIEFGPIPYEEYHEYILERFAQRKITINCEDSKELQDTLYRAPESINIVCSQIYDHHKDTIVSAKEISLAIARVIEGRKSRYEEYLSNFSAKEEQVLVALAKQDFVLHPNGQDFLRLTSVSGRAIRQIFDKFMDKSIIEKSKQGYHVSDPLLYYFLRKFR